MGIALVAWSLGDQAASLMKQSRMQLACLYLQLHHKDILTLLAVAQKETIGRIKGTAY